MAKRKPWSRTITAHGVEVRIFERSPGGNLYLSRKGERTTSANGKAYTPKVVQAIKPATTDRTFAEAVAKEWAKEVAAQLITTGTVRAGPLTFEAMRAAYEAKVLPDKAPTRQQAVRTVLRLVGRHLGDGFNMADFGAHHVGTYVTARTTGRLRPDDYRAKPKAKAGTVRNELHMLRTVCRWAAGYRVNGAPLLAFDPFRSADVAGAIPQEANPQRPVATPERYAKLAAVADQVDGSGQFAMILAVAWYTGRRINAVLHLRASDVLLDRPAMLQAIAEAGQSDELAAEWTGALRWRAEWDKKGYETFSPLPAKLREPLAAYLRQNGIIGDGWLLPYADGEPVNKARADYLLRKAERAAGLTHQARGGWHALRRGWASLRRSFPAQDVMLAGGWRDVAALQAAYQHADSRTTQSVVDIAV